MQCQIGSRNDSHKESHNESPHIKNDEDPLTIEDLQCDNTRCLRNRQASLSDMAGRPNASITPNESRIESHNESPRYHK